MKTTAILATTLLVLAACGEPESPDAPPQPAASKDDQAIAVKSETASLSNPEATDTVRQVDSHVHGAASLAIALDDNTLTLEFESPLFNLTGFEHEPVTDDQFEVIESAEAALNSPAELFEFNSSAQCSPAPDQPGIALGDDEHDHDEEHHEDGHGEEEHHGDEEHHEHNEDEDDETHSHEDVLISYTFSCARADRLSELNLRLFERFENLTDLDVVYLAPGVQTVVELEPDKTVVALK